MSASRIRIGPVWESTLDAARGRAALISPIALGAIFAPGVVVNVIALATGGLPMMLAALLSLAVVVALIWGMLAIIAIVTDPATTRRDAIEQASRRLPAALGSGLLLGVIILAAVLPALIALSRAGINWAALQGPRPDMGRALLTADPALVRFASFYLLGFLVFWLWLASRAMLTYAVALNERRGAGTIGRAIALTRGATVRLMAVMLLFAVTVQITTRLVSGLVATVMRLVLGGDQLAVAVLTGGIAGGLVSTVLVTVFCVFTGRLYVAASSGG